MKYLLYCVFHGPEQQEGRESVTGVGGQAVFVVSGGSLAAAVSGTDPSVLSPDIPEVLAYQKVIEAFHRDRTVIPMRYGNIFEGKAQVIRFLEEHRETYVALLKQLEGCVEMGVRVLFPERESRLERPSAAGERQAQKLRAASGNAQGFEKPFESGRAYLAARKALYEADERLAHERKGVIDRCRGAFAGLYVSFKTEESASERLNFRLHTKKPVVPEASTSLYFLVPKGSVEPFRQAFRDLSLRESAKLLLSGPWPPYNFVGTPPAKPHDPKM